MKTDLPSLSLLRAGKLPILLLHRQLYRTRLRMAHFTLARSASEEISCLPRLRVGLVSTPRACGIGWLLAVAWIAAAACAQPAGPSIPPFGTAAVQVVPPVGSAAAPPAAAAAAASHAVLSPPTQGQILLETAIRTLESRNSVSARIRQTIDLFGNKLVGSGIYEEVRPGRDQLIRLELRTQLGDQVSSLLQVCDGHYLWTYRRLLDDGALSRIDVGRAIRAVQTAEPAPKRAEMGILPGLGGLPRLVRGLYGSFLFVTAEKGQLEQSPVWLLTGQWKPQRLAKILPDQKDAIQQGRPPKLEKLPPHLPDQVLVFLGQTDLFPYRIEYRRTIPPRKGSPQPSASRPIVTVDLFDVRLNMPIDPGRFLYNPGNVKFSDQTDSFIKSFRGDE